MIALWPVLRARAYVRRRELARIGELLAACYGQTPGESEKARPDALDLLFADERLVSAWADGGSVRRADARARRVASTKFVIEAAAICPLEAVAPGFDLLNFHAAAYRRATARGVEFQQRPIFLRVWMAISAGIAIELYARSSSSLPVLRVRQSTARKHRVIRSAMRCDAMRCDAMSRPESDVVSMSMSMSMSMSKMWQMYLCQIRKPEH
jgi:hypothetical protein